MFHFGTPCMLLLGGQKPSHDSRTKKIVDANNVSFPAKKNRDSVTCTWTKRTYVVLAEKQDTKSAYFSFPSIFEQLFKLESSIVDTAVLLISLRFPFPVKTKILNRFVAPSSPSPPSKFRPLPLPPFSLFPTWNYYFSAVAQHVRNGGVAIFSRKRRADSTSFPHIVRKK